MPRPLPRFVRPPPKIAPLSRAGRWRVAAMLALATVTLAVQIVLADWNRFAASPVWRPTMQAVCAHLGCALPAWREPRAFVVLSREIQPHPGNQQALLVTASFRNDAKYAQDWPLLELALTDLDGSRIGLRRFEPFEYLGGSPSREGLAPGQSATVALEILDPGNRAVAFEFDFH
ncbi:MAG TPA: DUF3426 domain-containing protein [Xanthomonadaceae bacterium]|jgi:hypothetical protein|nr:DUF3426 domain-containing protein [Xanthomonadaceae bacterium]